MDGEEMDMGLGDKAAEEEGGEPRARVSFRFFLYILYMERRYLLNVCMIGYE